MIWYDEDELFKILSHSFKSKRTHAYGPMTQQKLLHARKDAPRE